MRRFIGCAALALALAVAPVAGAAEKSLATAHVTFVTTSSVYIDAGRDEGLKPGTRLSVLRDDAVVAVIEVADVSGGRAVCRIVDGPQVPLVGDVVQFESTAPSAPATAPAAEAGSKSSSGRGGLRDLGVRGRVGVRYLVVRDGLDDQGGFTQPALDVRIDGPSIAGSPWGVAVDVRARRIYRELSRADDSRTRVYRAAVSRRGQEHPWGVTLGRQFSPAFAAVSIFDGVSVDYERQGWSAGLFSGTQPATEDFGYSSDIREHGLYFQLHGRPTKRKRRMWQVTSGVIGSYELSELNREFVFVQSRYNGPRLSVFATQEVDYNRGWKAEEGASTLSPTSTFASVRVRATDWLGFHAGYDNRRNVRLLRDRITPITEFDDAFRRGFWGGVSLQFARRYRITLDSRTSTGPQASDAQSYTATFGASRLGWRNLSVRTRGTKYTNDFNEGTLFGVDAGIELARRMHLQLGGGVRDEQSVNGVVPDNSVSWVGLDFDVALGRHWYLILSAERTSGELEQTDQLYTTVSYRF